MDIDEFKKFGEIYENAINGDKFSAVRLMYILINKEKRVSHISNATLTISWINFLKSINLIDEDNHWEVFKYWPYDYVKKQKPSLYRKANKLSSQLLKEFAKNDNDA